MTDEQFQTLLDRCGADPARWPPDDRVAAERLMAHDGRARAMFAAAQQLDKALVRYAQLGADEESVKRVSVRLAVSLPRQKFSFWRLPAVLLDWQFAPAWPRVAALGACAVVGFAIGMAGVDRPLDQIGVSPAARGDLGALVFEPEALTGAQP